MAMGLKNAPATWSRMMHHILGKLTYNECLVYLDDIIVFSRDETSHLERLRHVFDKMRGSNLKFKPTKCHFMKKELEYLGHLIKEGGYTTSPDKTSIIEKYPIPKNVRETRAFLGLCGFYRKFVPNFAKISQPLTLLTRKNVKYQWDAEQQEAFLCLKRALVTPPVLKYPDFSKQFIVNTDASASSVAAILTQKHDQNEHPICYSSRTLNAAERRYSAIERECLAVIFAVKTYRNYLIGTHFIIITDHRPLKYLLTIKDPSSRLAKWAMYLMEYSFTILYRPGKHNDNVDALTRLRTEEPLPTGVIGLINEEVTINPITTVIWSREDLIELQKNDPQLKQIEGTLGPNETQYYLNPDGLLYRGRQHNQRRDQIMAPAAIVPEILKTYHNSVFAAHPGQKKTQELIQQDFFWTTMRQDVKKHVEGCISCNQRKTNYQPPVALQENTFPPTPWGRISLDIVGPLNRTKNNNKYLLTCVDYLTRYPECIPLPDIRAETVAKAFVENIICRFGTPQELLTDCGSQFVGKLFQEICQLLKIKKLKTTPYHPSGNGVIERMHKTLKTMISHFVSEQNDSWDLILPYCLMAYRNLPHEATQETPFFLMFGRDMILPFQLTLRDKPIRYDIDENYASEMMVRMQIAHEIAQKNIESSIKKRCKKHNERKTRKEFQLGELVYLKVAAPPGKKLASKFYQKWNGPYRILNKKGPVTFHVKELSGKKEHTVHADRLKPCKEYHPMVDDTPILTQNKESDSEDENTDSESRQDRIDNFLTTGRVEDTNNLNEEIDEPENEEEEGSLSSEGSEEEPEEPIVENVRQTRTREIKLPSRYQDYYLE